MSNENMYEYCNVASAIRRDEEMCLQSRTPGVESQAGTHLEV